MQRLSGYPEIKYGIVAAPVGVAVLINEPGQVARMNKAAASQVAMDGCYGQLRNFLVLDHAADCSVDIVA